MNKGSSVSFPKAHTDFLTIRMTDSIAPRFSVPSLTWTGRSDHK